MSAEFQSVPPAAFETLTRAEVLERHPGFRDRLDEDWWGWDEDYEEDEVIVLGGDHHVTEAWREALENCDSRHVLIEGDARLDYQGWFTFWVTGDVHGIGLSLTDSLVALGDIHSALYADMHAEDHEVNRDPPAATVHTPYLFSWFHSLDALTLSPDTVIFILTNWDYCQSLQLDNPVFAWHDAMFALRDEVQVWVEEHYHDSPCWNLSEIDRRLRAGESILRDGFDPAAALTCREAEGALKMKDDRLAWLYYRKAARQAPGYYPAALMLGKLLYQRGAYVQALPYLRHAASLFPAAQRTLYNEAAFFASVCALRLDQPRLALEIAEADIERAGKLSEANLYRARAEAHMVLCDPGHRDYEADDEAHHRLSAEHDLRRGLEKAENGHNTLNWLMGQFLHRAGRLDEAETWRQKAIAGAKAFDRAFQDHPTTAFLSKPATRVDWDDLRLEDIAPERDADWWRDRALSDPAQVRQVPAKLRTAELLDAMLAQHLESAPTFAAEFPESAYTPDAARRLVGKNAAYLQYVPVALIDKALCLAAAPDTNRLPLDRIPEGVLDHELCLHLLRCWVYLEDLPAELVDREICEAAVKIRSSSIEKVPAELLDDDLWLLALAHGGYYFVENGVPGRLKTPAMLKRALDLDRAALDSILGNLFDEEVYRHALALYGQDPDWAEIVARHGPKVETSEFARQCWLVFWDEELMLQKIRIPRNQSGRLASYEIPAERYTQAIADACFDAEPIHLDKIPPCFVTTRMAEHFIRAYPDYLAEVPLAHRSAKVCLVALADEAKQADQVPAAVHAEVFGELLQPRFAKKFDRNWLLLEHGRGLLMQDPPRIAEARADFEAILGGAPQPAGAATETISALASGEGESRLESRWLAGARFLLGYCDWLEGERERAAALLEASGFGGDYAGYDPRAGKPIRDFDRQAFAACLYDCERLMREPVTYAEAWLCVAEAERLLRDSGIDEPVLWAHVFDKQRWLSYELERWDDNAAICREAVRRLSGQTLWAYLQSDDAIRHTLRGAYHRLAALELEKSPRKPALADLLEALSLMEKTLALQGGSEPKSVFEPFYDTYLRVLLALSKHEPRYAARFNQTLERVSKLDWREFIHTRKIKDLLKAAKAQ